MVYTRSEREEIQGRSAAITLAKEWTADEALTVMVESVDGRVKMQFRAAASWTTSSRRARAARPDRSPGPTAGSHRCTTPAPRCWPTA
ncbi:MAG: hypothetical protein R3F43_10585 [bacterium]